MRATTSLPQPAGPWISTREPVGATRSTPARSMRDGRTVAGQARLGAGAQAQFGVLARQCRGLQRAAHHQQQPIGLERLLDEVVGALLDRRDRHLDRAVAGDHHHRHLRFLAVERLQQAQPVQPRALQPDVEDHQRRAAHAERGDRGIGVAGAARVIALVAAGCRRSAAGYRVRHRRSGCHAPSDTFAGRTSAATAPGPSGPVVQRQPSAVVFHDLLDDRQAQVRCPFGLCVT